MPKMDKELLCIMNNKIGLNNVFLKTNKKQLLCAKKIVIL